MTRSCKNTKQFHLKSRGKFTDFIKKQRPPVSDFETPFFHGDRTGERPFFMAEQFTF
jgi:hypothetical protein